MSASADRQLTRADLSPDQRRVYESLLDWSRNPSGTLAMAGYAGTTSPVDLGQDVGMAACMASTDRALLVRLETHPEAGKVWVPRSQLIEDSEVRFRGDVGILIVSDWFAKSKGWGKYREIAAEEATVVVEE